MKKLLSLTIIFIVFIGCNSDTQNVKLNPGVDFEEINSVKKKGFKFDKKNNYSTNKESTSKKTNLHKGCEAPCCADGGRE
tara:strand:+ start:28363 stop:28602 length:240 start_codon:yes stop_codon:yes gene_type:complete